MKNKLIDFGLLREGLRQTRIPGLAYAAVALIIILYGFIGGYAESNETFMWASIIGYLLALPAMLFYLFRFLNSRSGSDYYHSLPKTRSAVAISFSLAAYLRVMAVILGCALIHAFLTFSVYEDILITVLTSAICSLAVTGAVLISVTLSSSTFSQLLCAVIILFMPRAVITSLVEIAKGSAYVIYDNQSFGGWFLSNSTNLVFDSVSKFFSVGNYWFEGVAQLYTLLLGCIYIALGIWLYNRRRSEVANDPAVNRVVQTALRVLVAFAFCLVPCNSLFNTLRTDANSSYYMQKYLIWYGLALVAYILYEVITTKGLRGIKRRIPDMLVGFALLVALNFVFVLVPYAYVEKVLEFEPEPQEVKCVTFVDGLLWDNSYGAILRSQVEFDDEGLIKLSTEQLSENINSVRKTGKIGMYNMRVAVRFQLTDGSEVTRLVYFADSRMARVQSIVNANDEYIRLTSTLPKLEELSFIYVKSEGRASTVYSTDEQPALMLKDIYSCFLKEYEKLPIQDKLALVEANLSDYTSETIDSKLYSDGRYANVVSMLSIQGLLNDRMFNDTIFLILFFN